MPETKTYYVKVRPTNGGKWSRNKSYEFWTTVFDESSGNSYISIRDVPGGTDIADSSYWTLYSVNDARYLDLKKRLDEIIAGSTPDEAEIKDVRLGADGVTYPTAGEAVRGQMAQKINKDDAMSWSQWFDLHRAGWRGGVTFPRFSQSQSTLGTKTGDNADVVVETSTNEAKGRNDFADKPNTNLMFNGIDVNGYVDENGEPHITAVEGSPEFDRYGGNGDVYRAFLTPFYRRFCTDTEEGWEFADKPQDDMKPWAAAVRPDGTYRSFYFVAKYIGVRDDNGVISSISGRIPARQTISYNTQITEFKKKGTQYCGFTSTDMAWVQWMNDM